MKVAPNTRQPRNDHHARGVTRVESVIVTVVVAIVAGAALPVMGGLTSRQALVGAVAVCETDVQHGRGLAVAGKAVLRMSFDARDGASCSIVHRGAAGDCERGSAGGAVCRNGAQASRRVRLPSSGKVVLSSNVRSIVFDPVNGTSTPTGTVGFTEPSGAAVHQGINRFGRARSCSPGKAVADHKACQERGSTHVAARQPTSGGW